VAADYAPVEGPRHQRTRRPKVRRLAVPVLCALAVALVLMNAMVRTRTLGPSDAATQAPAAASRVISLVPAVTEMLFAIGAGDQVVGVSSFDRFPPEVASKPRVGALVDPDFERIISLRPDLVIVYHTQTDLMSRLERLHIPMFRYEHAGLADITRTIRAIGDRTGRTTRAGALANTVERDLDAIRRRVAGQPRPRTALLFGREAGTLRSIYASAGVGFLHDMLETAGGDDVFGDVKRESLQVTTEVLLARAPDVIVETRSAEGWTPARLARERSVWSALPSLPAVRRGRVYILADDRFEIPGPRVAESVRLIADVLHPAAGGR
jgi:iron complex transport system substrate-binding protein